MSGGTSRLMQTIVLVVVARVPIPIAASLFSRSGTRAKRRLAALIAYLCSGLLAICATTLPAHAAHRVALVIGNSDYINTIPLANPSNDANDIAKSLRALGFEVILGNNLDRKDTEDALQRFASAWTRLACVGFPAETTPSQSVMTSLRPISSKGRARHSGST